MIYKRATDRLMAHYIEPNEEAYACLVAAYLLRMTMFPENDKDLQSHTPSSVVRGYAYHHFSPVRDDFRHLLHCNRRF